MTLSGRGGGVYMSLSSRGSIVVVWLRALNVSHVKCGGGGDLVEATQCFRVRNYDMPSMGFLKIAKDFDISLPETRSDRDRPSPFRLETISGRNGPSPVPQKPPPESSVPGETLTGEGGGINSGGDMEAHLWLTIT